MDPAQVLPPKVALGGNGPYTAEVQKIEDTASISVNMICRIQGLDGVCLERHSIVRRIEGLPASGIVSVLQNGENTEFERHNSWFWTVHFSVVKESPRILALIRRDFVAFKLVKLASMGFMVSSGFR
jgi:hypothetical protein